MREKNKKRGRFMQIKKSIKNTNMSKRQNARPDRHNDAREK